MTQLSDYQNKYTCINFERSDDGVLTMTMHSRGGPAVWGTSLTSLHCELGHAFLDVARDYDNRVVILTGTGDSFIASFDSQENYPEPNLSAMWPRIHDEGLALLGNLLAIPVPMVAAVNGPALIHAELAALCDIVIASDTAEFADLAHVPGGAVPGDGVHTVWPMILGPNRGRYFLLTGERIPADEARQLGICAEVLPMGDLLPRARALASQLAKLSPQVGRHTRSLLVRELRRRMFDELSNGLALEGLGMLTPRPADQPG